MSQDRTTSGLNDEMLRNEDAYQCVVLLSGGLDSVAALFWARRHYQDVRAITFSYGQPARNAEVVSAGRAAQAASVQLTELALADALALNVGLLRDAPAHNPGHMGIDRANVPARNVVMLSLAAAHGSVWFKAGNYHLILGANAEDAQGFPDCRPNFVEAATRALRLGVDRHVTVVAPWINQTKAEIIQLSAVSPTAMSAILQSWSCYRAEGPCGECSACVKRAAAMAANGLVDLSSKPTMHGGDSHREYRP